MNLFVEDDISLTASYSWRYSGMKYTFAPGLDERINNNIQVGFTHYMGRGFMER